MKGTRFLAIGLLLCLGLSPLSADFMDNVSFSTTADAAYYPKSDFVASEKSHFAPITGAYDGLQARVTGEMDYTIPTPLGEHWLLSDANVVLGTTLELTPVSIGPGISATFTPVPFLVFNAGATTGTAWTFFGIKGMAKFDYENKDYISLTPFADYFYKYWINGTFQFDTGAIWAGDWHHFQIMYTYEFYYKALTALENKKMWKWQSTGEQVNGFANYQKLILAYQMPLVLSRVGVMCEWEGYYDSSVYENPYFKGDFKEVNISPLAQFSFTEKDTLSCLLGFKVRRGFKENHTQTTEEPFLTYTGKEFFFNRIAFSWTHNF